MAALAHLEAARASISTVRATAIRTLEQLRERRAQIADGLFEKLAPKDREALALACMDNAIDASRALLLSNASLDEALDLLGVPRAEDPAPPAAAAEDPAPASPRNRHERRRAERLQRRERAAGEGRPALRVIDGGLGNEEGGSEEPPPLGAAAEAFLCGLPLLR